MKIAFDALALGAALLAATPAMAAKTFDYDFSATLNTGDGISGFGTITTNDGVLDPSGTSVYSVTGATGFGKMDWMTDQSAVTGLLFDMPGTIVSSNGGFAVKNLPLAYDGIPYFFVIEAAEVGLRGVTTDGVGSNRVKFNLTLQSSAVPEATTWAQMIAGFGLVGGAMRFRRRSARVAAA